MANIRVIVQYAVPVVTGILGLLWLFGRKKDKKRSIKEPPSQKDSSKEISSNKQLPTEQKIDKPPDINCKQPVIPTATKLCESPSKISKKDDQTHSVSEKNKIMSQSSPVIEEQISHVVSTSSLKSSVIPERNINVSQENAISEKSNNSKSASRNHTGSNLSPCNSMTEQRTDSSNKSTVADTVTKTSKKLVEPSSDTKNGNSLDKVKSELTSSEISNHEKQTSTLSANVSTDSIKLIKDSPLESLSQRLDSENKNIESTEKSTKLSSLSEKAVKVVEVNEELTVEESSSTQTQVSNNESVPIVDVEDAAKSNEHQDTSPPNSDSPGCDSNSEASNDSGRGGSVTENLSSMCSPEIVRYEFNFPSELCGRLIGRQGKNINAIKEQAAASVSLQNNPFTPEFQICIVEGTQTEVEKALSLIRQKFPRSQFSQLDMSPINQPAPPKPAPHVLMPNIMQLSLPEGVSVDVVVSSIVDAGHVFVQQPTHPSFPSLERLDQCMAVCYSQNKMVPPLPRPIEVGVICVAPMMDGWYRAQIVQVYEDTNECDIKFVDYGGYERLSMPLLKQIRSDFMTLPFQAVECYVANITPLQGEDFFSDKAGSVLEELTQGKLLQAQVINRAEDGIPYIHIYQISGDRVLFVNRELVNRKVTRGIEIIQ
ncbi:A-kinase anchor protein 1, mitochondrial [Patella vulgata]|uniref:A-kinase anchor protein 1, mitochondrial n=1 Tax=Patella vulgata TaxID=6465 RepID=UPI00217FA709|nr:A-kinase anchor protein 1, mitochondrial [Patella vulgata]XP_050410419.1 A-kinase anchor protein 1, mitochondrial [Patella vulgata]